MHCLNETSDPPLPSHYVDCHEVAVRRSVQCWGDGNFNSKCDICFVTVNVFVHESSRDLTASTNCNTVQPRV